MLEKLTGMVTMKLAMHREYTESEIEIIHYGLYGIFANILQFVLLGILAIPLGIVPQLIAYLLFYEALRRYAGGVHAESQGICCTFLYQPIVPKLLSDKELDEQAR